MFDESARCEEDEQEPVGNHVDADPASRRDVLISLRSEAQV
jgi:hypothetical protein